MSRSSSLVRAAMQEIGELGGRFLNAQRLLSAALEKGTSAEHKKAAAVAYAACAIESPDFDFKRLDKILQVLAEQSPAEAFKCIFQIEDQAFAGKSGNGEEPSLENFVVPRVASLIPQLPKEELPICAALVFRVIDCYAEDAQYHEIGSFSEALASSAKLMVQRLEKDMPAEVEALKRRYTTGKYACPAAYYAVFGRPAKVRSSDTRWNPVVAPGEGN